jgi:hypothetical protein
MTDELPERAARAFESHDAFERAGIDEESDDPQGATGAEWFDIQTTRFDGRVTATETDDWALRYSLEVRAPMLSTATEDEVGEAVEAGWFETYELRLEDAPMAVRDDVELADQRVVEEAGEAVAVFEFEWGNADRAPDVAKAMAEYVEGTYVEGVVPGYEYGQPVSDLLSRARQSAGDEGDRGPMPL